MKKSVYRIILMIAALWHALVFFVLPYGKLEGMMGGLGQLAGALGMGDSYPESLTGLAAVKMANSPLASAFGGDDAMLMLAIFLAPFILGMLTVLINLIGKGKASYIFSILLAFLTMAPYGLIMIIVPNLERVGYSIGATIYISFAACAVEAVVALIGMIKDKGEAASAPKKNKGKDVKVGKKDGTITGVQGAYAGAVIPVKSGDTIVIGRDPSSCAIVVKDEKASRKHCSITYNKENGMYTVTDLSSNGVYDGNGNRIAEKATVPMSAGSEIRIGKDGDLFRLG